MMISGSVNFSKNCFHNGSFYFELKADKEFAILNQVNDDELVEVIRNCNATQIPKKDVVVGDVVIIYTGAEVPLRT